MNWLSWRCLKLFWPELDVCLIFLLSSTPKGMVFTWYQCIQLINCQHLQCLGICSTVEAVITHSPQWTLRTMGYDSLWACINSNKIMSKNSLSILEWGTERSQCLKGFLQAKLLRSGNVRLKFFPPLARGFLESVKAVLQVNKRNKSHNKGKKLEIDVKKSICSNLFIVTNFDTIFAQT